MARNTRSGGNAAIVHHPLPPPSAQKRFPPRRRTTRATPRLPSLSKKQSTLTQLPEWHMSSSSSSALSAMVGISDDDISEVEYAEPRPKKRRKKSTLDMRTDSQPSLTQWDRDNSLINETKREWGEIEDDEDDGFQILEDPPPRNLELKTRDRGIRVKEDERKQSPRESRLQTERKTSPSPAKTALRAHNLRKLTESPRETRRKVGKAQSVTPVKAATHGHNLRSSTKKRNQPKTDIGLRTPSRKVALTEIPSSQSPLSAKLSTQRSVRFRDAERSPLKERSANIPTTSPSPSKFRQAESQPSALKMLQRVRMECLQERKNLAAPAFAPPPLATVAKSPERTAAVSPVMQTAQAQQRALKRTATVQDSQYDDGEFDLEDNMPLPVVKNSWSNELSQDQTQYDGQHNDDNDDDDDDDMQPNTYDPAYSALDRDATRFLETQMQTQGQGQSQGRLHLTPHVSNSTGSGAEEIMASDDDDDDDLDRTILATRRSAEKSKIDSATQHQPSQELGSSLQQSHLLHPEKDDIRATIPDSEPPSQPQQQHTSEEDPVQPANATTPATTPTVIHIPSSPPAFHPSQVSTVVPTQISSPQRPGSRRSQWEGIETQPLDLPLTYDLHTFPDTYEDVDEQEKSHTRIQSSSSMAWPPAPEQERERPDEEDGEATLLVAPSSSPLPAPPVLGSSPLRVTLNSSARGKREQSGATREKGKTARHGANAGSDGSLASSSLMDFSLPPPPPMSSSSLRDC